MRYGIYFVNADDIEIDDEDFGFDMVREAANDFWQGNDVYELSLALIRAINNDEVNTENGYIYMVDLLEGVILS
jgi:hypothetical protein